MMLDNTRSAARALRVNKLRSVLTVLGVVVGVGAIIAMLAVGAGAQASLAEQIQSLGSNQIVVLSGSRTASGVRLGQGSHVTLTEDDALALQREIPAVQAAAPTASRNMQVVHANLNWGVAVSGVTPEWFEVKDWDVVEGRAITAEDHRLAAKVVLVGHTAAQRLFGEEDPIGVTVRIGRVPFTVVGLLAPKGQNVWGRDQDDIMMVPLSTARRKLFGRIRGMARAVNVVVVKIREGEDFAEAQAQMRELLRQRHRLQPERDDDFTLRDPYEVLQAQEAAAQTMAYLLAAVGAVSLLVGGIGIMNVMLVSVTERTREIGLRMAVGARRRDILGQFLVEALALALIGGAGGVAVGLAASHAIGYFAEWRTLIGVEAIALAFSVAPVVGIIFGLYPAHKAARLDPIDALRYE